MATYAVNEEGVNAMKTMASAIAEALEELESLTSSLQSSSDEYSDTLGPHKASLDSCLEEIGESIKQASEPASGVADKLNEVAEAYQEIIGNDRFSGKSGK